MLTRYVAMTSVLLSMTFGCKSGSDTIGDYAYIGGEIINPKNKNVVLYNTEGRVLDSITLDANNRFIHKINNLKTGLYTLTHGGEYQMVLLEPSDSIMFRLNTYDFDESLVFTGEGAKKNNYIIKTFLFNEREEKKIIKYAKMEPEVFDKFIEKRRKRQLAEFHEFLTHSPESDFFKSLMEANINYNSYADKEIYPFAYFGNNKLIHIKDLPEDFYDYRKDIDFNAKHLTRIYSYNRFLFSYIDNLAAHSYYKNKEFHSHFDRHTIDYNKSKLDIVDSIISDKGIKNYVLKYKTREYVSHNHTEAEANEMLNYYLEKSSNEEDKSYMKELVSSLKLLRQGNPLPNLAIINYDNTEYHLNSIINKPTIIYFWSSNSKMQYRNSHYKVKNLQPKFPNVDFISINLNSNDDRSWKAIIDNYNFPSQKEYKFKHPKKARKVLAVNYLNKAIIVDENATILHPNVNIFKSDFTEMLEELVEKRHLIAKQ